MMPMDILDIILPKRKPKDIKSSPIVKQKVIALPIKIITQGIPGVKKTIQVVKKNIPIVKKINTVPIRRELTPEERKVYNEKRKKGISEDHPSMPGNEKIFTSKQLFIIPKRAIPVEEELKGLDKEIKHHIMEMNKIDYKSLPIEIVKGIRDTIAMSRNTIAFLKSIKK